MFDLNAQHSGNNTIETALSPSTVLGLQKLYSVSLPDVADGAPAYLSAVSTTGGTRDLVFLTTKNGYIVALDAHTGAQIWSKQYGPGTCRINNGSTPCYTTSSPAIDPGRQYVYSYGLDGKVHRYAAGTGVEVTGGGWPETATIKGFDEKGSSALSIATAHSGTSYLYMANSGYPGDNGDYQGHVTTINLATGAQHVFNTLCSTKVDVHFAERPATPDCPQVHSAVWARPGVVYDPDTDKIYLATGNGTYLPASHYWGDSVLELNPDGTGTNGNPLDSYTPADYQFLQDSDLDLGSTAPAILTVPATSTVKHLAVQGGKDALLRLINLDNLSGQGGPGHTGGEVGTPIGVPQGGEVLTQPAVWVNPRDGRTWVFVANDNGISGLQLLVNGSGTPYLHPVWTASNGGSSPIIANNVLYYAGSAGIQALNPTSGSRLWGDSSIGAIHWESPIVANGTLYITDENGILTAYGLLSGSHFGAIAATGASSSYSFTPGAGGPATIGSCAAKMAANFDLYVYNSNGTLLASGTTASYCNWVNITVSAGQSYTVTTTAATGSGYYSSAWSINSAPVIWPLTGYIASTGGSNYISFTTLGTGTISALTCSPAGTNFDLYLLSATGTALTSSTAASNCQSLSYTSSARGMYLLKEVAVSGHGLWLGAIQS